MNCTPWIWYNKLDTKLREKVASFIMRRKFDKPFKLAAVKLVIEDQFPI
jgi:hypothetical protein